MYFQMSVLRTVTIATGGILLSLGAGLGSPQTRSPDRPQAFPFDAVATLMGFEHDRSAGAPDLEVRITVWSPLATAPTPLLRIVETNGQTTAQLFAWWKQGYETLLPFRLRDIQDLRCSPSMAGICATRLPLRAARDWKQLAREVVVAPMCESDRAVATDTRDLKVQIFDRGEYWRYGCADPVGRVGAGAGTKAAAAVMELLDELLPEAVQ